MELNEMEKRLIFQTEGYGRSDVTYELRMCLPYIPDPVKRKTAAELVRKLDAMPEKKCLALIQDIRKNYRIPAGPKTIWELLAEARQKSGAEKLKGHDIMALERFDPEVKHMIVFDVLSGNAQSNFLSASVCIKNHRSGEGRRSFDLSGCGRIPMIRSVSLRASRSSAPISSGATANSR